MWPRKVGLSILFILFSILGNKNISPRILLTILKLSNTFKKNWIYLLGDCLEKSWKGVETSHYPYPAKMLQFPRFPLAYFPPSSFLKMLANLSTTPLSSKQMPQDLERLLTQLLPSSSILGITRKSHIFDRWSTDPSYRLAEKKSVYVFNPLSI